MITEEQVPQLHRGNTLSTAITESELTMKLSTTVAASGLLAVAHGGLLRFGCAQLTVQRLDPLVNPGANPSPHIHQIIGGVRHFHYNLLICC